MAFLGDVMNLVQFILIVLNGMPAQAAAPMITLSETSMKFANQTVGTSSAVQMLTLKNSGSSALIFSHSFTLSGSSFVFGGSGTCALNTSYAPGASCTAGVVFKPVNSGIQSGSLSISSNASASPLVVPLSGAGVLPVPVISLSPSVMSFASQLVGTSSAVQMLTITNTGGSALSFSSGFSISGGSFAFGGSGTCALNTSYASGASCTAGVVFKPTASGAQSGSLSISSNAATSPTVVKLSGIGSLPPPVISLSTTSLTFPSQLVGTKSAIQMLTLTNLGGSALTFSGGFSISGSSFALGSNGTCTLNASYSPGSSCTIGVDFVPTAAGALSGTLSISSNASSSPLVVKLAGTGILPHPVINLSATSLAFANQTVGTKSAAKMLTLTNTGNSALTFSSAFAISGSSFVLGGGGTCSQGTSYAPGTSCTLGVVFNPLVSGALSGTLSIASNATSSAVLVSLSGTGVAPVSTNLVYSPYMYTGDYGYVNNQIVTAVTGTMVPVVSVMPSKLETLTLAFAVGTCGSEKWPGGLSPSAFAAANIPALVKAGKKYIISAGGGGNNFFCSSSADFIKYIQTYYSANMIGVDFDLETSETQADVNNLVQVIVAAQATYPNLHYSFTVGAYGGTLGAYGAPVGENLGSFGKWVMAAVKTYGLKNYSINLMAMQYDSSDNEDAGLCTLVPGSNKCNMGQSAVQAAINVHNYYGVPYSQIEVTPMIGGNGDSNETFSITDAETLSKFAVANKLGGVHFWEFNRDKDCPLSNHTTDTCNSYGAAGTLGFTNAFLNGLGF